MSSQATVLSAEPNRVTEIEVLPRVSHVLEHIAGPWAAELASIFPFPHTQMFTKSSIYWHAAAMVLSSRIASKSNARVIVENVHDWRDALHMAMPTFNRENASIAKRLSLPLWPKASYRQLSDLLEDKQATKLLRHADKVTPELLAMLHYLPAQLRHHAVVDQLPHDDEAKLIAKMFGRLSADHQKRLVDSLKAASSRNDIWKKLCQAFMSSNGQFPVPPAINDARVEPILTVDQLNAVSKLMDNCLRSFNHADDALSGEAAYYVFNGDENAVIQIEPRIGGHVITEIGGVSNKPLSDESLNIIKRVFADHGIGDETKLNCHWSNVVNCRVRNLADEDDLTSYRSQLVEELMMAVDQVSGRMVGNHRIGVGSQGPDDRIT